MPHESAYHQTTLAKSALAELDEGDDRQIEPGQSFFVIAETPCPYLVGRWERKVVTELYGAAARHQYDDLSRGGFRRSHHFAYRPACSNCQACVPVRVRAQDFQPQRSLARIARRNRDLRVACRPPTATQEQYALFADYIRQRHGDGEMAGMTFDDYRAMVEDTSVDTAVVEFRETDGRLIAACLADWLDDGASAVYSFFDSQATARSLGSFCIIWLIEEVRRRQKEHVYLGYWIAETPKMAYKARFQPLEGLGPNGWRDLTGRG